MTRPRIVSHWDLMQEFKAGDLLILLRAMREAGGIAEWSWVAWPLLNWEELKANTKIICDELDALDLPVTLEKAQLALKVLEEEVRPDPEKDDFIRLEGLSLERYRAASVDVIGRFRSEMGSRYAFALNAQQTATFREPQKLFGQSIFDAFPSIEPDLGEAAKCFALGRYTAAVFHGMRSLEAGLGALCKELGIDTQENWNKALNLIEAEIRSRSKATHGDDWKLDEQFFAEAATHFRFLKNAWRNHTMHLKEHYSEERALTVLSSVAGFMQHLSGRLAE